MAAAGSLALVLGGGGQFGAYQAGYWLAVHDLVRPDVVLGASIGAVNGWAVAAGVDPKQWAERWISPGEEARLRFRFPAPLLSGILDSSGFEEFLRRLCAQHQPKTGFGCALTELPRLRRRLVLYPEAGWRHLAASCALFGLLPQIRLQGRLYTDGGVLAALPLWAVAEAGARRALAIGIWEPGPVSVEHRLFLARPARALGSWVEMIRHSPENARAWVDLGYADGHAARNNISTWLCSEAE